MVYWDDIYTDTYTNINIYIYTRHILTYKLILFIYPRYSYFIINIYLRTQSQINKKFYHLF